MNTRAAAARAAAAVAAGRNLDDALAEAGRGLPETELPLLKAIAFGVLRERTLLDAIANTMLSRPLSNEPLVTALLAVGLFQLRSMRVPPHAAVAETVAATEALAKPWAKGLSNALLRRYQREREAIDAQLPNTPEVRQSYPGWLVEAVRRDWPGEWRSVLASGNEPAPLTLRVNRRRTTRDDYRARLAAEGLAAEPLAACPDALVLAEAVPVDRLPGFADGLVSVQDAAAQLAVELLDARPGMRVLDACAAPGGKTAHLLERVDDLQVDALDVEPARLPRLEATLARLGLRANVRAGDAARPSTWWSGQSYHRILIDAPCSGTGVIRRHPDIKWLRRDTDLAGLADTQQRLLRALLPMLAPDGVLVYATCSILKAEGEAAMEALQPLLASHACEQLPIEPDPSAHWGEACPQGRRIAPGGAFDGFYYARLRRRPR